MIFDLYTTLLIESVPQRTVLCRAMSRAYGMDNPIGDPFGGPAYGEFNSPVVEAVEDAGRWIDREVLQPVYREVIQPVGKTLEKIGQGIAKDPLTFIAQAAAIALAPATLGQSLWALPVIAAASTAAKGGSWEQILTATAISAATAAVGGGFGMENSVGGLIMNGMQTGGSVALGTATYGVMGTQIAATTASAIASAGTGIAMAGIGAIGAAAQGKDPFQAALPSLVGTALGFAGNMAGQSSFFAPITETLNDISKNVSPIVSKAMTGVASAMITGAVTGKDMTEVALAGLANTVVSGLVSASNVVAEFFAKDDGSITNLGVAAQSVVADLVGSVAATLASSGKLGTEMGAQFLANTVKTIMPFVTDPKFDAMATNVRATYEASEKKVVALNEAAKNQQALVDRYNDRVGLANSLADEVNSLVAQRDSVAAKYSASNDQGEINRLRDQFNNLEAQIKTKSAEFDTIYAETDEINSLYVKAAKATDIAQKEYFDISKTLGSLGTDLSAKMNEMTKQVTSNLAKDIDPSFNEAEYKELNNLGPNIDAATHFLSVGKDQGLFTNIASAEAQRETLIDKATATLFRGQGWGSITEVPESVYTAARDRIANFYGNNLQGLTSFTVADMVAQSKMPATWYAPMWDENTRTITDAKVLFNNDPTAKEGQVVIADTVLPKGMSVASFYDIQSGNANVTRGNDGNFYWTTNTGTSAKIYDPKTGEVVTTTYSTYFADKELPSGAFDVSKDEYGRVVGYRTKLPDGTTSYHATISGVSNPQAEYKDYGTSLDEVDPMTQMFTYSNVDEGVAANFNIQGIVQASKEVADYFQKDATDLQKLQVATVIKSGSSVLQDVGTVIGDLSVAIGLSKSGDNSLTQLGKQLQGLSEAKTPEQYKAAMKDIEAMRKAAQGTDIVKVNAAIAEKYPDLVGVSVFGGELFEEFIQSGLGKATGAAAGALALTLGAPAAATAAIAGVVGYGASMAMDYAESYRGAKEEMYTRMLDVYKGQGYSDAQAAQMADAAASKAGVVNGMITLAVNGIAPGDLNKVLFGGKANPAQQAMMDYFLDKVKTAGVVAASEFGQGLVEGTLQGAYNESLVYSVDPSKADYWKGIADSAMLESVIGSSVSAGTYGAANSFEAATKTFTLANEQFTKAITSGNVYTIGELGSVMKQWGVPASVSFEIVPDIVESNPNLLNAYSTPAELSSALTSSFGFNANQAADIANIKFNNQVTTADEAKTALLNAGLKNVSDQDVTASGTVGVTSAGIIGNVNSYTARQIAQAYMNANPDVKEWATTQKDPVAASLSHWTMYGKNEGRIDPYKQVSGFSSDSFAKKYMEQNDDVRDAFGADTVKLLDHFYTRADIENRKVVGNYQSSADAAANAYMDKYSDVKDWANTQADPIKAALDHWSLYGKKENRTDPYLLSTGYTREQLADAYNKANPEVAKWAATQPDPIQAALSHYDSWGSRQTENRISPTQLVVNSDNAAAAAKAAEYADKNMVTLAELQAAAKQENYTATDEELNKLVGRGVQADVIANFVKEIDPKSVTTAEATQYFKDLGYTKATAADIAQFVKSAPEAEINKAVAAWVDPRQVTRAEAINFFAGIGYVPTEKEINQYVVQGPEVVQDNIKAQLAEYVDPRFVDANEVKDIFKSMGLNAPVSGSDLARLSGQYAESELAGKAKEALPIVSANAVYALMAGDPVVNQNIKDEILAKIEEYKGLNMTQAEAQKAATQAVAAQLNTTSGNLLTALSATENNLLVKIADVETTLSNKIDDYKNQGLNQAEATAKALADMSTQLGATKADILSQLGTTESNLVVKLASTKQELVDKIDQYRNEGLTQAEATKKALDEMSEQIGVNKADILSTLGATEENLVSKLTDATKLLQDQITANQAAGMDAIAATNKAVQDVATQLGTTTESLRSQISDSNVALAKQIADAQAASQAYTQQQVQQSQTAIMDKMQQYQNEGKSRDEALQLAIRDVSTQLGTTANNLLAQMGTNQQQLLNTISASQTQTQQQIADTKKAILDQMQAYQSANMDADTALDLAISGVAQDLGLTRANLVSQIGTTEANLRAEFTQQTAAVSQQVQDVAKLLGKPASQVTAADVQAVQGMIGGQAATNLAYDTNNDGKVDQTDLTNIQNKLAFDQNTNIKQQVDPETGITAYIDTTTGKEVSPPTIGGAQWTSTGIYEILEKEKAQAAATAKAQAAKAKTAQQQSQFGQLMGMLFQAPDIAGQQVAVKTPDPAKIGYIYDFSSIFANPSQASMMPSPYGPMNAVAPKQPQQAANQPLFQLASGFAEGGIVNSNDIQVGGSMDDLINILKGN